MQCFLNIVKSNSFHRDTNKDFSKDLYPLQLGVHHQYEKASYNQQKKKRFQENDIYDWGD